MGMKPKLKGKMDHGGIWVELKSPGVSQTDGGTARNTHQERLMDFEDKPLEVN